MTDPTTQPRVLAIPELSLVALVGASGSGKSTFARRHFGRYEVISSDVCRGMVSVDENDQSVTADAFELLGHIAGKRLAAGHLTVVDATNVQRDARGMFSTWRRRTTSFRWRSCSTCARRSAPPATPSDRTAPSAATSSAASATSCADPFVGWRRRGSGRCTS
jgi:Predicted kinase